MTVSVARASIRLGKALAPRKPAKLTFAIVRQKLAERGVTIRPNEWGEYRLAVKGAPSEEAQFVSRSHDQQETLQEALDTGRVMADFADKVARVAPHAARLEKAYSAPAIAEEPAALAPVKDGPRKQWRLGSSPMIHAPGIVAWAINGYAFKKDRAKLEAVISDGWSLPIGATKALLSKAVPYRVDGETVVFEVAY